MNRSYKRGYAHLISLMLLGVIVLCWHILTTEGATDQSASEPRDEYAELMGNSSGVNKSGGFPTLSAMGETIRKELSKKSPAGP